MAHRCPRCGSPRAERRTARNYRERAALAVLGRHPYRCLECDRRFLDRPGSRSADPEKPEARTSVIEAPAPAPEPEEEHAATLAITTSGDRRSGRVRRRARWVVDAGDGPLGRTEVYAIVLATAVLLLVALAVIRFMWPEATGGVKLGGD